MNPEYQNYSVEEFTHDEQFRRWVIQRDPQSEAFWLTWLEAHPEAAGKVQLARAFLYALEEKDTALSADELVSLTSTVRQRVKPFARSRWGSSSVWVAAAVCLVLGISYGLFPHKSESPVPVDLKAVSPTLIVDYQEVQNTDHKSRQIRLQDGSSVTLYPNSRLRYPNRFAVSKREVYLSGRAFFRITKNPRKPFWVHTDQLSTQVLGTSFWVTAEGKNARVEVRSGRVSVYTRTDIRQARQPIRHESVGVVLTANQQVVFIDKENRLLKSVVQQPVAIGPIDAREYLFEEEPLENVFKQLEKTYGLPVLYDPVTVVTCFITADLSGESLFDKLNLVCRISQSTYELVDGQIIIHSQGCAGK